MKRNPLSTFKNKLPNDLKVIWELTRKLKMHNSPDTSDAWMRLEQRLDMEQNAPSKIQSGRLFPLIQPRLVYAFTILFVFVRGPISLNIDPPRKDTKPIGKADTNL